jgi:Flp pilus assembly pilin Flp
MIRIVRYSGIHILRPLLNLMLSAEGQDLIEYALAIALIALTATAGISGLATKISTAFSTIATRLTNSTT